MDLDRHITILTAPSVTVGSITLSGTVLSVPGEEPVTIGPDVTVRGHLREVGVGLFLLVCAVLVGAVCGGIGSFLGTAGVVCMGVLPALLFVLLGVMAMVRSPKLEVATGDQKVEWTLTTDTPKLEIEALVARIARDSAPAGPLQEATLVLQGARPKEMATAVRTAVERDVSKPLPEVDDGSVMERLAKADRAWDVTFSAAQVGELIEWGTSCNAIVLLGDGRSEPTADPPRAST